MRLVRNVCRFDSNLHPGIMHETHLMDYNQNIDYSTGAMPFSFYFLLVSHSLQPSRNFVMLVLLQTSRLSAAFIPLD